jgi:hypothetical protein
MMLVLILRRHLFLSVEATSTFNRFVRRSYGGASVMLEVLGLSSLRKSITCIASIISRGASSPVLPLFSAL